jgi:uncharacterized cupredoxin-like copper-binding protein
MLRLRRADQRASRRPLPRRGVLVTVAVAAAIGLAACGGDDDEGTTAATTAPSDTTGAGAGTAQQTVDVTATDFKFDPSDPSVKPGTVAFKVTNDGETLHNLEVEGPSGSAELAQDLDPGQDGEFTVDLDKPGKYEFICPVGNHAELGMVGEVTVQG